MSLLPRRLIQFDLLCHGFNSMQSANLKNFFPIIVAHEYHLNGCYSVLYQHDNTLFGLEPALWERGWLNFRMWESLWLICIFFCGHSEYSPGRLEPLFCYLKFKSSLLARNPSIVFNHVFSTPTNGAVQPSLMLLVRIFLALRNTLLPYVCHSLCEQFTREFCSTGRDGEILIWLCQPCLQRYIWTCLVL